ncbi:uncharacterized protein LOC102454293 [Pelodiscus sinensis]|uniref:uncharacterized protein LOC102454293 n=1 Tax=Pelodiscus sinensis TaxID=13735 RepID=UPI003F6BCBEA
MSCPAGGAAWAPPGSQRSPPSSSTCVRCTTVCSSPAGPACPCRSMAPLGRAGPWAARCELRPGHVTIGRPVLSLRRAARTLVLPSLVRTAGGPQVSPGQADAYKPGINPAMAMTQTQSGAKAGASNIPSQLIFFLCRASSLRGKQADIQKILKGVKKFSHRGPAALVGVIVQPKKEEAAEARKLMESLLQGAFPRHPCKRDKQGGKQGQELEEVEVEVEIFIPGQPRGKLAIMKAACRASEALQQRTSADVKQNDAVWISRATLFKLLGALCVACAGIIGSQYMNTSI